MSPQLNIVFYPPVLHLYCPLTLKFFPPTYPFFLMPHPIYFPSLKAPPFPIYGFPTALSSDILLSLGWGACSREALCQNKHTRFHLLGQHLCTHFLQMLAFSFPLSLNPYNSVSFLLFLFSLCFAEQLGIAATFEWTSIIL